MKYILAKSAAEALEALLAEEGKARIIAGGSDVMVDMEAGKLAPQTLVDITTADDMKGIRIQDDQLIIGAAVTLTEIARSPLIRQYFPSLCKGARQRWFSSDTKLCHFSWQRCHRPAGRRCRHGCCAS